MTINELEQGIRNLIATQPMATAGVNGEVIAGINAIIDSFRNLNFRIQSYPCQDVMKFGLANESAKFENTLSNLALQVLQERGINLMLYVPRPNAGFGAGINQYGMVNPQIDANMMMGQMMYNSGQMPQNTAMMPVGMMGASVQNQPFNQMQPQMMGVANATYQRQGRAPVQTYPGYQAPTAPVHLEPVQTTAQSVKTRSAPQDKIKPVPKASSASQVEKKISKPATQPTAQQQISEPIAKTPSPAEMLIASGTGGAGGPNDSNAKGRDYLMELLKK